jgi:hypothetical protein
LNWFKALQLECFTWYLFHFSFIHWIVSVSLDEMSKLTNLSAFRKHHP